MARAPPAGRVFATALEPRLTTAASRTVSMAVRPELEKAEREVAEWERFSR